MGFTMTAAEIIRFLKERGFIQKSGGRHQVHLIRGKQKIPIPDHSGDLAAGTLRAILKKAGYTPDDVMEWRK